MTRIAFFAPLKSPHAPNPSGDRQIARNLMTALERGLDAQVELASELRIFEPIGDASDQVRLATRAQEEIARITSQFSTAEMWVTYHNYYKAPDLIGPAVSNALGIPYVLIEATRARSRLNGPWAHFAQAAEDASDAAAVIFHFTANDLIALERDRVAGQQIVELLPFLNRDDLPIASDCSGPMLAVGMMRPGDKLASYQIIAETLSLLNKRDWRLDIVGDGPARPEIEALFARFGARVRLLGMLDRNALESVYARASSLIWPGVNEAFGMVYLEAQAAGLPIIAQDRPGVRDVLPDGDYPSPEDGPAALANITDTVLSDSALRKTLGSSGRSRVSSRHLLPAASRTLRETLKPLLDTIK